MNQSSRCQPLKETYRKTNNLLFKQAICIHTPH